MFDSYLLLTPALTFMVVALAGFVGCNWWFGIEETEPAPPVVPPEPPTGLTAVGRDREVVLSWDPYTGADKLTLRMGMDSGTHPFGRDVPADDTTYPWPDLTNEQTYWFTITATVGALTSAEAEEVPGTPGLFGVVTPFLDQTQLGSPRQFNGWMGVRITTGPNSLTLRALGRWYDANQTGSHAMRIAAESNPFAPLALVTVTQAVPNAQSGFVYADLSATIQLAPNTNYFVVSSETSTGETFRDSDSTRVSVLTPNAGADVRAAFGDDTGNYTVAPTADTAYGPVNLLYTRP